MGHEYDALLDGAIEGEDGNGAPSKTALIATTGQISRSLVPRKEREEAERETHLDHKMSTSVSAFGVVCGEARSPTIEFPDGWRPTVVDRSMHRGHWAGYHFAAARDGRFATSSMEAEAGGRDRSLPRYQHPDGMPPSLGYLYMVRGRPPLRQPTSQELAAYRTEMWRRNLAAIRLPARSGRGEK